LAECAAGARQAFGTQDQQDDGENQDQVGGLEDCVEHVVDLSIG
jgi:hypothetical protein